MPNPLPQGFAPRSLLDSRTIVAAGRLVMEKQYTKLVEAFADVADQLPGWRLRILGQGHQRPHLVRETRKRGLFDRVELPGSLSDMRGEWAKASICALSSRSEGFPLV
ncbi:MAG TPA: glycosyltransferase, partial [Microlunatus sp.]